MIGFALIAAAAVATGPLEPAAEADMRCVAAMLYAVGDADQRKDQKMANVLLASVAYFSGKIDGRVPGADYRGHIARLANSPDFAAQLPGEIKRCALEAGAAMQLVGKAAQAAGNPAN
jgi:hypothetical protein